MFNYKFAAIIALLFAGISNSFAQHYNLNGHTLFLKGFYDYQHSLMYVNTTNGGPDGPVLRGYSGGILGTNQGGKLRTALYWNNIAFVGIGTQNPTERLQIGDRWTFHDGGIKFIGLNKEYSNGANRRIVAGRAMGINFIDDANNGAFISFSGDNTNAAAGTALSETYAMVVHANGRVGIGVAESQLRTAHNNNNGDTYRLFVKGGIKTEEVKVELCNGSWCDYVFKEDYQLTSLEEVENTIQTKGHLHKIESAETIEKEGLELKSMTINQQEKIEEIYLHLIEMNKRIKTLEKENAALKTQLENTSK